MPRQRKNSLSQETDKSPNVADTALKAALLMLPLYMEEGVRREVVPESELVKTLVKQDIPENISTALIYTLRRQFEALALLDPAELHEDKWAFVSFPASLLGRSWLTTLATPGQALLGPDYWEQGDACPGNIKDEQRALLHRIETERVRLNPKAQPIRVVHVAWAFIRWGDKFLLHHREDKARPGEKNYVLPGGRFNLSDLPHAMQSRPDILKETFNLDSAIAAQHITATLERELKEETDLNAGTHYTSATFGKPLPPYQEVNGAGNRHAYSAYQFHLFQVKLTPAGETHLLRQVAEKSSLTWFTAAEIAAPQRADGAAAYVDVLRRAWNKDLERHLSAVPNSAVSPLAFTGESQMLDLPESPGAAFQLGKPGKEKPMHPVARLEDNEWQLLMLLGWHTRGFPIQITPDAGIDLLENGWLDMPRIISLAHCLHGKIQPIMRDLMEIREDRFVSLRIDPGILFFSAGLFRYQILDSNKVGGKLRLKRLGLPTPWGCLSGDRFERDINGNTVAALRELEKGDEPDGDWDRSLRDQLGGGVRDVGLRKLCSTKGNAPHLVEGLRPEEISPNA